MDTVSIKSNLLSDQINHLTTVYHTREKTNADEAWLAITEGNMSQSSDLVNQGVKYAGDNFWIVLKVANEVPDNEDYRLRSPSI